MGSNSDIWDVMSALCTSLSTSFDVGSDVWNSLEFLGIITRSTISNNTEFPNTNDSMAMQDDARQEIHIIWGTLGICTIFLPGILLLPAVLADDLFERNWKTAAWNMVRFLFFPILLLISTMLAVISKRFREDDDWMKFLQFVVGAEAFFESFIQLTLQEYTILYGYPVTKTQIATMVASFIMLARASILFEIQRSGKGLSCWETIIHTVKILPCYGTTIIFRTSSLTLTIGYLRQWSVIPIGILYLELAVLAYLMCSDVKNKVIRFQATYFMSFSNLAVINTQNADYEDDEKPSDEKTATFIRRSSILTFCHHTTLLVILMCLGQYQPEYFQEQLEGVVLLPNNGKEFFYLPGFIIVLGFYSMVLSLHVADKVARLEVGTIKI